MTPEECKTAADVEKLSAFDLVRLGTAPASQLDLLLLRLGLEDVLEQIANGYRKAKR